MHDDPCVMGVSRVNESGPAISLRNPDVANLGPTIPTRAWPLQLWFSDCPRCVRLRRSCVHVRARRKCCELMVVV